MALLMIKTSALNSACRLSIASDTVLLVHCQPYATLGLQSGKASLERRRHISYLKLPFILEFLSIQIFEKLFPPVPSEFIKIIKLLVK